MAKLAGVSQPTVSRALRDDPRVSATTKQRVRDAASALGYLPSAIGRALSVGHSTRVGLVVTDLENQFYAYVIAPMHHQLERLGYELVLITESSESAPVTEHVLGNGLCGVVLATTTTDSTLPSRLRERGVPFVYFNRIAESVRADSVTVDPGDGLRELVQAMARLGHSRVGAIFGPRNTSTGEQRENVIRELLDDFGMTLSHRDTRHGPFAFDTGYTGTSSLLDRADPPTVIMCGNDVVALGALNAARALGASVPGDVSVVGFDDLPTSRWALVQLSTVAYDLDEMSRQAARLLVARVERPDSEQTGIVLPSHYVPRATLGAPRS